VGRDIVVDCMNLIRNLFSGYIDVFRYLFNSKAKAFLNHEMISSPYSGWSFPLMILILGIIGVLRNVLEIWIGGAWAREWFSWSPDIMLTMFFYPIFLCFFASVLLHFLLGLFKIRIRFTELFLVMFFLQISHLAIPFLDGLGEWLHLPYHFIITDSTYAKLIFTPLGLTPLIILFTWPTSLGIDVIWFFVSIFLIKLFVKHFNFKSGLKSHLKIAVPLALTFYIVYLSIYPLYYFFINENIIGSNYMFGLFFLFMSIPSVVYAKSCLESEHERIE
jgi:hypothetical protein